MISAVLIYNQSVHSATGFTPFSLLYDPYDNLNAHKIDLDRTIYENYNEKRKSEVLTFYEQLYCKQLDRVRKILERRNVDKEANVELKRTCIIFQKTQNPQGRSLLQKS